SGNVVHEKQFSGTDSPTYRWSKEISQAKEELTQLMLPANQWLPPHPPAAPGWARSSAGSPCTATPARVNRSCRGTAPDVPPPSAASPIADPGSARVRRTRAAQ
ncbi:MAG: hypothetical protein EON55_25355, partial [Alphaproteobacteria bacterium]